MMKNNVPELGLLAVEAIIGTILYFFSKTKTKTENLYKSENYMHEKLFNEYIIKS